MLQFKNITPIIKEIPEFDYIIPIQFSFNWEIGVGSHFYWYTGSLLEICLNTWDGSLAQITLISPCRVYQLFNQKALTPNDTEKIGLPAFKTKKWPQDSIYLDDHRDKALDLYLQDDSATIILWPHPIAFTVKNERVICGFDSNKGLCLIQVIDLTEQEITIIQENINSITTSFRATQNTLNYAHVLNKDFNLLQLKDIKPVSTAAVLSDPNTPLTIIFDTPLPKNDSNIIWSIDGLLELQLDQMTGSLINITLLQAPSVYSTTQLKLPNSLHDKVGMPTFKTKEWAIGPISADVNHQKQFDVFLTKNSLAIVLWPHYAALTITNERVTFGFNANKTLCSITINNFTLQEMDKLIQSLRSRTPIIEASQEIINYDLLTYKHGNMLQLKDVSPVTSEQIKSDFDRPLSIKFCKELAAPENYIDWRIDRFIEIGLNRITGAIEQFTLRRNCEVGRLSLLSTVKLTALQWINKQKGLPTFKTLLWFEGIPEKGKYQHDEYMLLLNDDTVTIEFSSHRIASIVVNQRVIFGFNCNQSLCSITITDLKKDEMKLLIKSLDEKIKNL